MGSQGGGSKGTLVYEEALTAKRIEFVKRLKVELAANSSVSAQAVAAYTRLLDDVILDVAIEVHRAVRTGMDDLANLEVNREAAPAPEHLPLESTTARTDIFGRPATQKVADEVVCMNCGRRVAAVRFAPHLEKCLGKGRNAARAGSRRMSRDGLG